MSIETYLLKLSKLMLVETRQRCDRNANLFYSISVFLHLK